MTKTRPIEVDRSSLVDRFLRRHPTCTIAVAPAGYGKSRLARAIGERLGTYALCDVAGVENAAELAKRIVLALVSAGAPDTVGASQAVAASTGSERAEEWDRLIDTVWHAGPEPALLVVENAEEIASNPELIGSIARLAVNHKQRRLMICSRVTLESPTLRRMPPNEVLRVGIRDLEFTDEETCGLLMRAGADTALAKRAAHRAQGWPIAALVFAQASADNKLEEALAHSDAARDVHDYVMSQAFGSLDGSSQELLAGVARLSPADANALAALETSATAISQLARSHPFFAIDGEAIVVHPLALEALTIGNRGCRVLIEAAGRAEPTDPILASRLFAKAGATSEAARLLGSSLAPFLQSDVPVELADVVASIPSIELVRYPLAWAATTLVRAFNIGAQQRLDEGRAAWKALDPGAPPLGIMSVGTAYYNNAVFVGLRDEADVVMAEIQSRLAGEPADSFVRRITNLWEQWERMRRGHAIDAEDIQNELPELMASPYGRAAILVSVTAYVALSRLDRDSVRSAFANGVEAARAGRSLLYQAIGGIGAAFWAWFFEEDTLYHRYLDWLACDMHPVNEGGVSYFLECATSNPEKAQPRTEIRYQRAFAAIIGSARTTDPSARRTLAEFALTSAQDDGTPIPLIAAWLCVSFTIPNRRAEALARAREHAAQIEGGAWTKALDELVRGDGPLSPFKRRFSGATAANAVLRLAKRTVTHEGREVLLSARELAVLAALLAAGREIDGAQLATMVSPDDDIKIATNALRVWISRIRAKFPDFEIIESTKIGYRPNPRLVFDIDEAERALDEIDHIVLARFAADDLELAAIRLVDAEWADRLLRRHAQVRERVMAVLGDRR